MKVEAAVLGSCPYYAYGFCGCKATLNIQLQPSIPVQVSSHLLCPGAVKLYMLLLPGQISVIIYLTFSFLFLSLPNYLLNEHFFFFVPVFTFLCQII